MSRSDITLASIILAVICVMLASFTGAYVAEVHNHPPVIVDCNEACSDWRMLEEKWLKGGPGPAPRAPAACDCIGRLQYNCKHLRVCE